MKADWIVPDVWTRPKRRRPQAVKVRWQERGEWAEWWEYAEGAIGALSIVVGLVAFIVLAAALGYH